MMTADERVMSLKSIKRSLIKAHDEISGVADFMEARLTNEYEAKVYTEYSTLCQVMGILEEQIAQISNQIKNFK